MSLLLNSQKCQHLNLCYAGYLNVKEDKDVKRQTDKKAQPLATEMFTD